MVGIVLVTKCRNAKAHKTIKSVKLGFGVVDCLEIAKKEDEE